MNINIKTIPHDTQRYSTCGDWIFDDNGDLNVFISDMNNKVYEWLVAEHEINEALICLNKGISEKSVSDFDMAFEKLREQFPEVIGDQEPGDMVSAPYFLAHQLATNVEQHSASIHGVDWAVYSKAVNEL